MPPEPPEFRFSFLLDSDEQRAPVGVSAGCRPLSVDDPEYDEADRKWVKGLSEDELDAWYEWKKYGYKGVRQYQQGSADLPPAEGRRYRQISNRLEASMSRAPVAERVLYRGLDQLPKAVYDRLAGSKSMTLDAMASSSQDRSDAEGFALSYQAGSQPTSILMRIKSKTAVNLGRVEERVDATIKEQEWVLRRGSRYRVVKVEEETDEWGWKRTVMDVEEEWP